MTVGGTAGILLRQLGDGLGVGPCQLLHQTLPVVFALIDGDKTSHAPDYPGKVGIHIALPRLVDDVKHLDVALTAILFVQLVCRFDAVDFSGCPDAVIGKFHTGIRRDPHKVKCIRVFGHQICTKAFARRQAGSIAGLNRKQRCFVFFGKAIEDLAADGQFHTTVAGSTGFHRVLPIKNIEAPIPVADLRLVCNVLRKVFRDLRNLLHPQHTLIFNARDQQCTVYHPIGKLAYFSARRTVADPTPCSTAIRSQVRFSESM